MGDQLVARPLCLYTNTEKRPHTQTPNIHAFEWDSNPLTRLPRGTGEREFTLRIIYARGEIGIEHQAKVKKRGRLT
jgi:hypothetical protein